MVDGGKTTIMPVHQILKRKERKVFISKRELAQSGKKFYKFFFRKRRSENKYWSPMSENTITYNSNNSEVEGIFFAEEANVMRWFDLGDTLVEVIFDKDHPSYKDLPDRYFYEAGKYCGSAIFCGKFIPIDSDEMFEFIKTHSEITRSTINHMQHHLIYVRAFNTLQKLWEYKYSLFGDGDRKTDEENAGIILRSHYRDYHDLDMDRIISCETFADLIMLFPEDKWDFCCS